MSDRLSKTGKCALCGGNYGAWGNNPQPVLPSYEQRVCDECNSTVVIPARIEGIVKHMRKEKDDNSPKQVVRLRSSVPPSDCQECEGTGRIVFSDGTGEMCDECKGTGIPTEDDDDPHQS